MGLMTERLFVKCKSAGKNVGFPLGSEGSGVRTGLSDQRRWGLSLGYLDAVLSCEIGFAVCIKEVIPLCIAQRAMLIQDC